MKSPFVYSRDNGMNITLQIRFLSNSSLFTMNVEFTVDLVASKASLDVYS